MGSGVFVGVSGVSSGLSGVSFFSRGSLFSVWESGPEQSVKKKAPLMRERTKTPMTK